MATAIEGAAIAGSPKRLCLGSSRCEPVPRLTMDFMLLVAAAAHDADLPALMAVIGPPALDVLPPRDFWRWRVAAHPERAALCAALLAPLMAPGGSVDLCRIPRSRAVGPRRAEAPAPARRRAAYLARPYLSVHRCAYCDAVTELAVSHLTEFTCASFMLSQWAVWRGMPLAADDVSCDACVREHGVRVSPWGPEEPDDPAGLPWDWDEE
jgi:hypothetical protein